MSSADILKKIRKLERFITDLNSAQKKLNNESNKIDSIKSSAKTGLNVDGKTFGETELNSAISDISDASKGIDVIISAVQNDIAKKWVAYNKAKSEEALNNSIIGNGR